MGLFTGKIVFSRFYEFLVLINYKKLMQNNFIYYCYASERKIIYNFLIK